MTGRIRGTESGENRKCIVAEQLWLHYYNRVLYERGMISEAERNRMSIRINARDGSNFH